jgi:SSS family solute:Na+ symporter
MVTQYPSEMAQNFWTAIWAWCVCFVVTIAVSIATRAPAEEGLGGLVYSLTPRPAKEGKWHQRPGALGAAILAGALALNLLFW